MTEQIGTSNLLRTWANNGTVVVPASAKIDEGWLRGEQPPHEWMNYIHNVLGQKVNHALSRGAADWNGGTEYLAGATVNRNGVTWLALATNTNSEPSDGNTNWAALYSRDNILGTVSESSGVPTGAVLERGSNSNGEFVRLADGTQICWRLAEVDLTSTASQTHTFPAAFSGSSPIACAASIQVDELFSNSDDNNAVATAAIGTGHTVFDAWIFRVNQPGALSSTTRLRLFATGRWF